MYNFFSGIDTRSDACQRFFREGLTISFTKILTDEAVNSWKIEIHVSCFVTLFKDAISKGLIMLKSVDNSSKKFPALFIFSNNYINI